MPIRGRFPSFADVEPHLRLVEVVLGGIKRLSEREQTEARVYWLAQRLPKTAGWLETKLSWGRE